MNSFNTEGIRNHSVHPPSFINAGGIDPPTNFKKGVDLKFWVKRGWLARRGNRFERGRGINPKKLNF